MCGEGSFDECHDAIADEEAEVIKAMRGQVIFAENGIHGFREVTEGIEQGAVEVEEHGLARFLHAL